MILIPQSVQTYIIKGVKKVAAILYLSNKLVQVIEAKEKRKTVFVQNVWQEEAPEGSIINGIITDEEAFASWIRDFFAKNKLPQKEISLVVNSSQFNHKVLEFPQVKDAEIKKMIPREFSEYRTDNTLFTYYVLDKNKNTKMQSVLATAVEKEFLLSYINLFKQAGIEISSIDSEINSLVRLFSNSPEIQNTTCMIQILDGREVISMLFVEGRYFYSQKNRLFSHEILEEMPKELLDIRDKLFQFATAQKIKEPIRKIYLCGKGQNELKNMMMDDKIFLGEKVICVDKAVKKKKIEFMYPAGSLLGKKQGSTFFRQLKQEQKEKRKQREIANLLFPPVAVLLVCLLITAFMGKKYLSGMDELSKLQKFMQESNEANASFKLASSSVEAMKLKISIVEDTWDHLMSYPVINSSTEKTLKDCAGAEVSVELKSFQRDSGVLTLEAQAKDVSSITDFISGLQEQEIFEAVEYSGFTYVTGVDIYNIHVVLCMAEGAGR